MPYFMRKERDKHCVFKGTANDPGDLVKCFDTPELASAHIRGLMKEEGAKSISDVVIVEGLTPLPMSTSGPEGWESMTVDQIKSAVEAGAEKASENGGKWSAAFINNLPDSSFLYVESGKKDDEDKTEPRTKRHLPYKDDKGKIDLPHLRNAITRLAQKNTGTGDNSWLTDELRPRLLARAQSLLKDAAGATVHTISGEDKKSIDNQFIIYKHLDTDTYRWLAITNVAMWDREDERLTDKAYDDAITLGNHLGYGELDLVHVDGTDVGNCDLMLRLGSDEDARLVQGGAWYDSSLASRVRKSVQSRPDYYGLSIKFVYDPDQFSGGVYHGGIRIKKCTILPRRMAASHGTAIAVLGGDQMKELDQETKEALIEMGASEDEVKELVERSKSLQEEPNTVTKEDNDNTTLWDQIKALVNQALKKETPESEAAQPDVAEQSKETETEVAPVEETQEKEVAEADVESIPVEPVTSEETVKAIAGVVAQSLAPSIKAAVEPLVESLTSIAEWQQSIEKRLLETEKDIETKVTEMLDEQPPIVKVRTTELKQAEDPISPTTIMDDPSKGFSAEFMTAVQGIVSQAMSGNLDMPEIKLSK